MVRATGRCGWCTRAACECSWLFFRFLWLDGEYDLLAENNRGSDPAGRRNVPRHDWQCQRDAARLCVSEGIYSAQARW